MLSVNIFENRLLDFCKMIIEVIGRLERYYRTIPIDLFIMYKFTTILFSIHYL